MKLDKDGLFLRGGDCCFFICTEQITPPAGFHNEAADALLQFEGLLESWKSHLLLFSSAYPTKTSRFSLSHLQKCFLRTIISDGQQTNLRQKKVLLLTVVITFSRICPEVKLQSQISVMITFALFDLHFSRMLS